MSQKQQSTGELVNTVRQLQSEVTKLRKPRKPRTKKRANANFGGVRITNVRAPIAKSAQIRRVGTGKITIRHTEPVVFDSEDLLTHSSRLKDHVGVAPVVLTALLGVGSTALPFLATLASQFVKGGIKQLMVEYIPSCSTSTTGDVILSASDDPTDARPTDPNDLVLRKGAVITPAWARCRMTPPITKTVKYVPDTLKTSRASLEMGDADMRLDYQGKLMLGLPIDSGSFDGRVMAHYTAELVDPAPSPSGVGPTPGPTPTPTSYKWATPISGWVNPCIAWPSIPSNAFFKYCPVTQDGHPGIVFSAMAKVKITVKGPERNPDHYTIYTPISDEHTFIYFGKEGAWSASSAPLSINPGDQIGIYATGAVAAGTVLIIEAIHVDSYVADLVETKVTGPYVPHSTGYSFWAGVNKNWPAGTVAPCFDTEMAGYDHQAVKYFSASYVQLVQDSIMIVFITADKDLTGIVMKSTVLTGSPLAASSESWDGTTFIGCFPEAKFTNIDEDAANNKIYFYTPGAVNNVTSGISFTFCQGNAQV
jgi:hypothetical protein